jgi:hypothetical protein
LKKIDVPEIENDNKEEEEQVQTVVSYERQSNNKEKPSVCQYHLGYLSERVQSQQIPEDCIVCKDIVECMLRKMRM